MRKILSAIVASVVLLGCAGPTGPTGPQGVQGEPGPGSVYSFSGTITAAMYTGAVGAKMCRIPWTTPTMYADWGGLLYVSAGGAFMTLEGVQNLYTDGNICCDMWASSFVQFADDNEQLLGMTYKVMLIDPN